MNVSGHVPLSRCSAALYDALTAAGLHEGRVNLPACLLKLAQQQIRRFGEPLLAREYYLVFNKPFCRENGSLCERWWHEIQQRRDALFAEKANDYR